MTTDTTATTTPHTSGHAPGQPGHGRPRWWAVSGLLAGAAGLGSIVASSSITAVYEEELMGDAPAIVERLSEQTTQIFALGAFGLLAMALLVPFAAGLRRRLAEGSPAGGSLLPDVAYAGLLLTCVAGLMGTGLNTEFGFALATDHTRLVPEVGVVFGHWTGTIPWLWVGAGLTGVAVALAALRQGAAPRWLGWASVVLGGLTLVAGLSPLQYVAGFVGPVYVLVLGMGFAFGDRASR